MKKEMYRAIILGEICFIVLSIVLRLIKGYMEEKEVLGIFPWGNEVGIILLILAAIFFIFERLKNMPFFYGISQHGGSNSNSFIVFAIAITFFSFNNVQFTGMLICISIMILVVGILISNKKNN